MDYSQPPPNYGWSPNGPHHCRVPPNLVYNKFAGKERFQPPPPRPGTPHRTWRGVGPPQPRYTTPPPPPVSNYSPGPPPPQLVFPGQAGPAQNHFPSPPCYMTSPQYQPPAAQHQNTVTSPVVVQQYPSPSPSPSQYPGQFSQPPPGPGLVTGEQEGIPDLRPQFLSSGAGRQLVGPGQLVLLPPLQDRSVQTIHLLSPSQSGQYTCQTLVLPIVRVPPPGPPPPPAIPPPPQPHHSPPPAPPPPPEEILLNEVDGTGLPRVMQGVDLDQVKKFASDFRAARLRLGLTQSQVGQALTQAGQQEPGLAVSQSTICRFEKLEITALQVKKLLPALQAWLVEAEQRQQRGLPVLPPDPLELGRDLAKRRKKRTVFNQEMTAALTAEFEMQPSPSSSSLAETADRLGLDKETVRVWFCNKRQQTKKHFS